MRTLNIGMIGYGFMGKTHTYAYHTIPFYYDPPPADCRLSVVCRTTEDGARRARAQGGFARWTTDPQAVIDADDVDVVHVCTPNHLHREHVSAAIRAGKHIYCEKPLTGSLADAEAIAELLSSYTAKGQMVHQNRFFPATLKARELAEQGFLGPITHFRGAYLHGGSVDPDKAVNWKSTSAAGGGVIRDLGPHILDLLELLAGPIASVCATSRIWSPERPDPNEPGRKITIDVEDAAALLVRTADGAFGTVDVSKIATGTDDELRFEVHGRHGAMRFDLMQPNYLEVYDTRAADGELGGQAGWQRIASVHKYPAPGGRFPSPKASVGWLRSHVHCLYGFLRSIVDDTDPSPSLADGVRMQRVLEAAITSAKRNAWVDVT